MKVWENLLLIQVSVELEKNVLNCRRKDGKELRTAASLRSVGKAFQMRGNLRLGERKKAWVLDGK